MIRLLLVLLTWAATAGAQTIPVGDGALRIGPEMAINMTAPPSASAAEILRAPGFAPRGDTTLDLGFTRGTAVWLRARITNPSAAPIERVLTMMPAPPQLAELHIFTAEGLPRGPPHLGGRLRPADQRDVPADAAAFLIRLAPGETVDLLLRSESRGRVVIRPILLDPREHALGLLDQQFVMLAALGGSVVLLLVTLALFAIDRQPTLLLMALRLATVLVGELGVSGILGPTLWPDALFLDAMLPAIALSTSTTLLGFFILAFLPKPFAAPTRAPLLWLSVLAMPTILGMVIGFSASQVSNVLTLMVLGITLLGLLAAALALREGFAGARLLLLGMLLLFGALVLRFGVARGVIEWDVPPSAWVGLGSVMNVILLAAIMDRGLALRMAAGAAQARALSIETELRARLEQEVAARTTALEIAKREAEQANHAKTDFLARVGHELRTPLHSILGYAALIRATMQDREQLDRLRVVEVSGRHLLGQIEDLLRHARGDEDVEALSIAPFDPTELIDRMARQGEVLAAPWNVRFVLHDDQPPGALMLGDARRIEQVLLVLLTNAMRAAPDGEVTFQWHATQDADGWRVDAAVIDNGRGIPLADQARIFQPFERGAEAGGQGLGLGLPIAARILERMGSAFALDSTPGQGSRFAFTLRLGAAAPDVATPIGLPIDILLVEDDADHAALLSDALGRAGHRLRHAPDLATARCALVEAPPEILLLDQNLPDGTGWDLLAEARMAPERVIMVSANDAAPPGAPRPALFLRKPLAIDALLRAIAATHAAAVLPNLADAAAAGDVFAIENWLRAARDGAAPPDTIARIEAALGRLEFDAIAQLARGAPPG